MKFTDQIAAYIQENEFDLNHLIIVLPSERAKKYIAKSLFDAYQRPIIAPKMITIDRWVKELCPKTVIDKTRALIQLFQVQLENAQTIDDHSFDEFMNWGNLLLSDFDELDRYLLDSKQLFRNLADIKEIENWSFANETLTDSQKRFMEFWDRLPGYYNELNKRLEKDSLCYMGQAYRFIAENIDVIFKKDKEAHFIFAGFNALSASEISIMKQLHRMGRGHILINADKFYLETESHEAGRFLRRLKNELEVSKFNYVQDGLLNDEKNIEIIECVQVAGQAKVAATLLDEMTEDQINQTMILLADESLMVPVLKNLPKKVGKANITLGLPLKNTAVRTWVDLVFNIQENQQRFRSSALYFNDIQRLWNHPFINNIITEAERKQMVELESNIVNRNAIFIKSSTIEISPLLDEIVSLLTLSWNNDWKVAMQTIRKLNSLIYSQLVEEAAIEKAALEGFDRSIIDLENIVNDNFPVMKIKSFKTLFTQHWGKVAVAYHGNPMDGLQIMGLLETRLLDFETIICLGMNEGAMPPTNPIQTMIPMDLRQYFGLPTPRDKQGLFAHHFYRLLHSCKTMHITYTSAQEKIGSNEKSRYLMQLELELSRLNTNIHLTKKLYSIPNYSTHSQEVSIQKTEPIVQRLDAIFAHSTSASMLKKFATCPLDFYYQYVLEFGEEKKVEEEVENNTFGTFIHNALENLYQPFARYDAEGKKREPAPPAITSFDIDKMLKEYTYEIDKQFYEHFNQDKEAYSKGKNLLSYQMALELTKRFLQQEKKFLMKQTEPVFIEALERQLISELEVEINGEKKKVRLKGFVDRIDSMGSKFRIIDYKSGKVEAKDTTVSNGKNLDELENLTKKALTSKHVLQLLMYGYLFKQHYGFIPNESSIISFININVGTISLNTGKLSFEKAVDLFPEVIQQILTEIYNTDVPFMHQQNGQFSYCAYC